MKKRILIEDDRKEIEQSINVINNTSINTKNKVGNLENTLSNLGTKVYNLSNKTDTISREVDSVKIDVQNRLKAGSDISSCVTNGSTISKAISDLNSKTSSNSRLTNDVHTGRALKFWTGTQAEYDAISTKDGNTLYLIKE